MFKQGADLDGKKKRAPAEKYAHFFWKIVVQSKLVKVSNFQEQGLEVFLEKLEAHKLVDLFTNSTKGCSIPMLAKFYTNFRVYGAWDSFAEKSGFLGQ